MRQQSWPKPKTSRSQASSSSLCVRDLVINVLHTRFLPFARVFFFCDTSVCNVTGYILVHCRPNMRQRSLPKLKPSRSQANNLSLCVGDLVIQTSTCCTQDFWHLPSVLFNTSVCITIAYILVHLQAEHGTAITAKTENLAKSSRQLEIVCSWFQSFRYQRGAHKIFGI